MFTLYLLKFMKLLTKQNCSACETVKQFIKDAGITGIQIMDCTNDLVSRQKMSEAGVMTFPALDLGEQFIYPSGDIIKYLAEQENSKATNNSL